MNVKRSSSSIAATASSRAPGVRLPVRAALLLERRKVGEGQHVSERGKRRAALLDLRSLRVVLAEDADRLRVLEDVAHVGR